MKRDSRREPTWAYQYGKGDSQQSSNKLFQSAGKSDNPMVGRFAKNYQSGTGRGPPTPATASSKTPTLYESLSTPSNREGESKYVKDYMNRSGNAPVPSTSNITSNKNNPTLLGRGFAPKQAESQSSKFYSSIGTSSSFPISSSYGPNSLSLNSLASKVKSFFTNSGDKKANSTFSFSKVVAVLLVGISAFALYTDQWNLSSIRSSNAAAATEEETEFRRPNFVYEHPYVSSTYYTNTRSAKTLFNIEKRIIEEKIAAATNRKKRRMKTKTRLAIVRPFCEFDAEALPTTFTCWDSLIPCKTALNDLGDFESDLYGEGLNNSGTTTYNTLAEATADVFLFYSQTFSDNPVSMQSVDAILDKFHEPGGWSQCFDNIYAIEANIPQELDLYIPSAQEELYNWVNGPNRQFEAAFRIIQSGEWGEYDGFYLMEGDSIPVKTHWLDQILHTVEANRPFAILGAKYNGDKWDSFYESIPLSLLHHINGNAIYNTSHPLLERLVGQLEIEAPCPYNSIPYDYRMSQMMVEGAMQIVPELAPKIMMNEEGGNITLSNNTDMFTRWWNMYKHERPFKETPVIHNYAATNLIPRHLGPEYVIHGAKLYSPWDPARTEVTLVVSEWFFDRSEHLLSHLDHTDHPFSKVILMLPPDIMAREEYNMTVVPVKAHHRSTPDYMDLCDAPVETDWFMITNSYHHVATHVDLMFTPGTFKPVVPFTPATYPFCFKFPYCKETVNLAQRANPGHDKVVQDFDMLYNTEQRNKFCDEWREKWGVEGEDLYKNQKKRLLVRGNIIGPKGPTGTAYSAFLFANKKDGMYKFTDRSLYGARNPFIKIFSKEEKMDGMTEEELAKLNGVTAFDNSTDCDCSAFESKGACNSSPLGCVWRPLFDSCRPPEMIDGGSPICVQTKAPTFAPTVFYEFDETMEPTSVPTKPPSKSDPWYANLFKTREHSKAKNRNNMYDSEPYDRDESGFEEEESMEAELLVDSMYDTKSLSPTPFFGMKNREHDANAENVFDPMVAGEEMPPYMIPGMMSDVPPDMIPDVPPDMVPDMEMVPDMIPEDMPDEEDGNRNLMATDDISGGRRLSSAGYVPHNSGNRNSQDNFVIHGSSYYLPPSVTPAGLVESCPTWGPSVKKRKVTYKQRKSPFSSKDEDPNFPKRKILASSSKPYFSNITAEARQTRELSDLSSTSKTKRKSKSPLTGKDPSIPFLEGKEKGRYVSTTNYRDRHPFEGGMKANLLDASINDPFKNFRIKFDTSDLENLLTLIGDENMDSENRLATEARIDALLSEVLPSVSGMWHEVLKVVNIFGNLFPTVDSCGGKKIPTDHKENGIPNSDMVIYVTISSGKSCTKYAAETTLCNFDQHMRPIVGNLAVCLDQIQVDDEFNISVGGMLDLISFYTLEVGKMLGLSPKMFGFFRNLETGRPWGSSFQTVTCVDGSVRDVDMPNIVNTVTSSVSNKKGGVYEVISPTVLQVVRNHFDCQKMTGAQLENTGSSDSCFGSHWNRRFFFDEDLVITGRGRGHKSFSVSPLTLALLEDSSWYKADYSKATTSSFGHGAGCGYVEGDCIVDGEIPSYSNGFFCKNSSGSSEKTPTGCDYTHTFKGSCNLVTASDDKIPKERQFFEKFPGFGSTAADVDFCPMRSKKLISCEDSSQTSNLYEFEVYGDSSKCFETNGSQPVCLEASCNADVNKIEFTIKNWVYQCDFDGQRIEYENGLFITCPRIATFCPDMICPANCSGKGICNYCAETPECICDDPFSVSKDCSS